MNDLIRALKYFNKQHEEYGKCFLVLCEDNSCAISYDFQGREKIVKSFSDIEGVDGLINYLLNK